MNFVDNLLPFVLLSLITLPIPMLIWAKAVLANQALDARIRRVETHIRIARGGR